MKLSTIFLAALLVFSSATISLFSSIADAEPTVIKFQYWENHSLYSCSYVEGQAERIAKKLRATDIKVKCTGGLPWNEWVSAKISFVVPEKQNESTVTTLRVNEACDFNQKLIEKIVPAFNPSEVTRKGVCWESKGRLRYTIIH